MPLNFNNFDVASIQATIFTPGLSFSQAKILTYILTDWGKVFDGESVSLPTLEGEVPLQIPRILITSADNNYKIEVAPARLNIFWLRSKKDDKASVKEFHKLVPGIFEGYRSLTGAQVGRVASVITRIINSDDPANIISNKFCRTELNESIFKNAESFELHSHKKYTFVNKYNINSWVRLRTGFFGPRETNQKVLSVEQDINTLNEESNTRDFTDSEITTFFSIVDDEMDSILSKYFPLEK